LQTEDDDYIFKNMSEANEIRIGLMPSDVQLRKLGVMAQLAVMEEMAHVYNITEGAWTQVNACAEVTRSICRDLAQKDYMGLHSRMNDLAKKTSEPSGIALNNLGFSRKIKAGNYVLDGDVKQALLISAGKFRFVAHTAVHNILSELTTYYAKETKAAILSALEFSYSAVDTDYDAPTFARVALDVEFFAGSFLRETAA
jgi:hypothetical protein